MKKSEQINELATALSKAQVTFTGARKGSENPHFNSSFADLKEVIECVKEPLSENGLSFCQFPLSENGAVGVTTILMHSSGQFLEQDFLLPPQKPNAQGYGSAVTYAKRYALQAILGIPSEDDDGNSATSQAKEREAIAVAEKKGVVTPAQIQRMYSICKVNNEDAKAIINKHGFSSSKDITPDKYDAICYELSMGEVGQTQQ